MALISSLPKNLAVISSTYVLQEGMPILYISHDDDDGGSTWQFHCGNGDYSMEKMFLVSLNSILHLDSGLGLLDLEIGQEARRETITSEWIKVSV